MAPADEVRAANLEELRAILGTRVAMVLAGAGGIGALASLPGENFRFTLFALGGLAAALGVSTFALSRSHPKPARWVMLTAATALLILAMCVVPWPWLPLLALLIIFTGSLLIEGCEIGSTVVILAAAGWLNAGGSREYDVLALAAILVLGVVLARLAVNTLYEALQWAYTMQRRADELLEETRQHRGELARTLKSLELAYSVQSRTQQELISARRQAEEAQRVKERFAANVSHELRTPLNIILGFSELMALSPEIYGLAEWPPALRRDVHQVYRSSSHLLAMIDDILDLSHFEVAGFTLHRELTPVEALIGDVAQIVEDLFRDRPVEFRVQLEGDLPFVDVDRTRLRQVLLNLLNNARRFTERGHVLLSARQENGEVIISVGDTGPGIPADKLPLVFDEFYQVDASLSRRQGGTGLGLAICKQFVEVHGGRIWAESREGEGSVFHVGLPVPGWGAPATYLRAGYRGVDPVGPPARPTVLVVDADPMVATFLGRRMEQYEVMFAPNPAAALEQLQQQSPRIVLLNLMPGSPPPSCPAFPNSVPVIQCSLPSQAWLAAELPVVASLSKPVTSARLLPELDKLEAVSDVLVVDDDRAFVQLVHRMLEGTARYRVRHAYDGKRALVSMAERRPDVLLLDLMMPEMDGFDLLEAVQAEPNLAGLPVILLTATSFAEDALRRNRGRLIVEREAGFASGEALRCVQALINALAPTGHETAAAGQGR